MKQRKLKLWAIAILVVCLVASLALAAACNRNGGKQTDDPTYYLSVDGASYSSASDVPDGVKFTKSDDVYKLTVSLVAGNVLTVKQVGSDDVIGYDSLLSTAGKLTLGASNSMEVVESGTFAFTLDVSDDTLLIYTFSGEQSQEPEVTVTKLEITESVTELPVNDLYMFVATVTYSNGSSSNEADWTSSNPSVATVNGGIVKALEEGETVITASKGGKSDDVTLTVTAGSGGETNISVTLNKHTLILALDETEQLQATVTGQTALLWESSNTSVVTVDQSGNVTAVGYGTATVKVSTAKGGKTDECAVTVSQPVKSISLSKSSLEVYVDGPSFELSVTINPSDATNPAFTVNVQQSGSFISYETSGQTISITGLAVGTATLTVTSEENPEITATCTITVKELTDAKPMLDHDNITLTDIGDTDTVEITLAGGTITSFTATAAASTVTVAQQSASNTFTVTAAAFGTTTVSVSVTYGSGSTVTLSLTVRVVSEYFYLVGTMDGTSWTQQESLSAARQANVLLEQVDVGIYELTRDFAAGNKFYILQAVPDADDWTKTAATSTYYKEDSSASGYGIGYEGNNMQLTYTGSYKVRLDLTGSKASWTIIVIDIAPTSASITADETTLKVGGTTTANLTLTIGPDKATVDASDISWTVDAQYSNWLLLTPGSDGKTCVATLHDFTSDEEVHVTVTVTVTVGNFTVTATREIVLMPEGASEKAVTGINFDQASYDFLVDLTGWTITVSAHVNSDATNQGVSYSIVNGKDVLYNGISGTYAFSIDSDTGLITAKQFGTITVRATALGNSDITADIEILIYSKTFVLAGSYGDKTASDWSSNTTEWSSSSSSSEYVWTDVTLYANNIVVILYSTSDWDNGVIRSSGYLNSSSTSNVGGTIGADGRFTIKTTGIYTITLDLSGTSPSVKFDKTSDVSSSDTWTKTISEVSLVSCGNTWSSETEYFAQLTNQTITNNSPYVFLTYDFSSSAVNKSGAQVGFVINGTWYTGETSQSSITFKGDKYRSSWTTGYWYGYNGQLTYVSTNPYNTTWTFIVKFDEYAALIGIQIESGTISSVGDFTDKLG